MPPTCSVVFCTCPDEDSAREIAGCVVAERLAACVNRVAGVRSTYVWDDKMQDEAEVLLVIKTASSRVPALQERLVALHPHELPEVVAVPISNGLPAYLDWVEQASTPAKKQ